MSISRFLVLVVLELASAASGAVFPQGELQERLMRNFDRMETPRYRPDRVFLDEGESQGWPGDTEGRTILALVMDARATGREPQYLDGILKRLESRLNRLGYMGPVQEGGIVDEQQLAGNGWLLRGLCEHWLWKKRPEDLALVRRIAANLFAAAAGLYSAYPVDPAVRNGMAGGESGHVARKYGRWALSSDVGCFLIGLDGFVQARDVLGETSFDPVIDEMIACFLKMDLLGLKVQAHAALTGIRALLRRADGMRGIERMRLVAAADERFSVYERYGMTENFENYNWFGRYGTWSEPCAIVDSYLAAVRLWRETGDVARLELADCIWWNGICRTQRTNGGFGLDNCPGRAAGTRDLYVHHSEAYWCCTMRGAEGLHGGACSVAFADGDTVTLAQYRDARVSLDLPCGEFAFTERTQYPHEGRVEIEVTAAPPTPVALRFFAPSFAQGFALAHNSRRLPLVSVGGFVEARLAFRRGDVLDFSFVMPERMVSPQNAANAGEGTFRRMRGPLVLARDETGVLSPVWHKMDPAVWKARADGRTILFSRNDPYVRRIFRDALPTQGETNMRVLQPIDGASWIWPEGVDDADAFVRFACDFRGLGEDLVVDVSADCRFTLFVDGRPVARGPHRGEVFRWPYQTYTIAELGTTPHRIEAVVQHDKPLPSGQLTHRGGFILKASGAYDGALSTGKGCWKAAKLGGMKWLPGATCFGARYSVSGTSFLHETPAEGEWRGVVEIAGPVKDGNFGSRRAGWVLVPSERPDMMQAVVRPGRFASASAGLPSRPGETFEVAPHSRVEMLWDFGDYFCAYPRMSVAGGRGARIKWGWAESLVGSDGRKGNRAEWRGKSFPEKLPCGVWDEFLPDGRGDGEFDVPWWRAGRWCKITIETASEALTVKDVAIEETHYPFDRRASMFASDDASLDEVWRICRRGLEMCSHETYMDCPFFEQCMYPGDTRIEALVAAVLSGDDRLTRYAIRQFDDARRSDGIGPLRSPSATTCDSATYTMYWIMMLRDYATWHRNRDWLKWRLPGMRHALSGIAAYANSDGLVENLPGCSFVDGVTSPEHPFPCGNAPDGRGLSAVNNLLYLNALRAAEFAERACGESDFADLWRRRADGVAAAVRAKFWCGEKALFADTAAKDRFSEHAQCLALLGGALGGDDAGRCFAALVSEAGMARASTYFSFYLFETYAKFGRADLIARRLDDWKNFLAVGAKTPFENQDIDFGSDCHAWSTAPLYFAGTVFAGVTPSAPFFGAVRIAPQPGGLGRVCALVPTPNGSLGVELEFADGEAKGFVTVPDGLPAEFAWKGEVYPLVAGRQAISTAKRRLK